MNEHVEQPEQEDVEGHLQLIDDEGRPQLPAPGRLPLSADEDDDVAGHVLDLDIERRR